MQQVKEALCFCSTDFSKDLDVTSQRGAANTLVKEYVLPDFIKTTKGHILGTAEGEEGEEAKEGGSQESVRVPWSFLCRGVFSWGTSLHIGCMV